MCIPSKHIRRSIGVAFIAFHVVCDDLTYAHFPERIYYNIGAAFIAFHVVWDDFTRISSSASAETSA